MAHELIKNIVVILLEFLAAIIIKKKSLKCIVCNTNDIFTHARKRAG